VEAPEGIGSVVGRENVLGRKRRVDEVRSVPYAKYGMTAGVVIGRTDGVRVGMLSVGWPTWGIVAMSRGHLVKVMILKNELWANRIRNLFPGAYVVLSKPGEEDWKQLVGIELDLWLSDV